MLKSCAHGSILVLLAVLLVPHVAAERGLKTLTLEGGPVSFSTAFGGESPPGSGLQHAGRIDADSMFGLGFEYGIKRYMAIRGGLLIGDVRVAAASDCPSPDCVFMSGGGTVVISAANWAVDQDSSFTAYYLELPFFARPGDTIELFAGPTVSIVSLEDVGAPGIDGLVLNLDTSTSYGFHAGASFDLGFERKWLIGVIARTLPVDVDITLRQPVLVPINEPFADKDNALVVGLRFGRRFGP